jgi:uncharacterized membrane protein (UPF0182 family)
MPTRRSLGLTTPQVYYGELLNDYSIVGAAEKRVRRQRQTTSYVGKAGCR